MGLDHVRSEIEHMRDRVGRRRREILRLQRARVSTASAELMLQSIAKIDDLCDERDRLKKGGGRSNERARLRRPELVTVESVKRYDEKAGQCAPWAREGRLPS